MPLSLRARIRVVVEDSFLRCHDVRDFVEYNTYEKG